MKSVSRGMKIEEIFVEQKEIWNQGFGIGRGLSCSPIPDC
jgi:hypothetical protein